MRLLNTFIFFLLIFILSLCKNKSIKKQDASQISDTINATSVTDDKKVDLASLFKDDSILNKEKLVTIKKNTLVPCPLLNIDSVLNPRQNLIKFYWKKYAKTHCYINEHIPKIELSKEMRKVGKIKKFRPSVTVFVMPCIECGDDYDAYYFSDTILPRLEIEEMCGNPDFMFNLGDIDEDGVNEIGLYHTMCASRWKTLYVYSLKNNEWKKAGQCEIDLWCTEVKDDFKGRDFRHYIKKTGKGRFKMLQKMNETVEPVFKCSKKWLSFKI